MSILSDDYRGDNLLFETPSPGARLKLVDYGLSRVASGNLFSYACARGAQLWWAPELFETPDRAPHTNTRFSDMWSAGLLLYEIACGDGTLSYCPSRTKRPVQGHASKSRLGVPPEETTPLPRNAHPIVVRVMRACLKFDPAARIDAATAFAELLGGMDAGTANERYCVLDSARMAERFVGDLASGGSMSSLDPAVANHGTFFVSERDRELLYLEAQQRASGSVAVQDAPAVAAQTEVIAHTHSALCNHDPATNGSLWAAAAAGNVQGVSAALMERSSTEERDPTVRCSTGTLLAAIRYRYDSRKHSARLYVAVWFDGAYRRRANGQH